ncbi:M48 family metallopeptidase [Marinobacter zhanjiangensis]|uniref:Zn-dependent protease n=1 Tax=Marinobacter zhanjiangensis TaxID=578215 RepID=A0ABQ3B1N6_9GAMM|nr:M48 family metallopeptidase [Marinobacter zhanjiangensis]GGY70908.1 Zn-dependent protease [Marinobacter zhanjiangensis]
MPAPGFFERQTTAKRNTTLLVFLFALAVTLIALAVCVIGYLVTRSDTTNLPFHQWLISSHGLITAGTVVLLITGASAIRWLDLAGGGERVARMVNARLLDPSSQDPDERRFRNIVEEMAIASGVPVPQLYIMDNETAINAFVAGYSPNEAVMVVTHGALTQLTRDELQGVVGHEFSHILNGDMRINVRLIALLAGILAIGQIGFFLLYSSSHRHSFRSSGRNDSRGVLLIIALALTVIGYLGVFCGRLIQAAVSRERERLADASSVQFTRNPEGIGGALYKIGLKSGYLEHTSHASDMNHMCFGESTKMAFSRLLGSHPPVDERIEAIQPGLMTRLRSRLRDQPVERGQAETAAPEGASGFAGQSAGPNNTGSTQAGLSSQIGTVTQASELHASKLLNRLPANVRELLYTRSGAVQFIYALLIHDLRDDTAESLLANQSSAVVLRPDPALIRRFTPTLDREGDAIRLPALELAMPALRKLDPDERQALTRQVAILAQADGRVTLFEFALHSFLKRHLAPDAGQVVPVRYRSYRKVMADLNTLFSLMARAGTGSRREAESLHRHAIESFADRQSASKLTLNEKVSVKDLRESLRRLNQLSPMLKPGILDACAQCVRHDGKVDAREYELIRIVADQLDCPLPPLS